MKTIIDGDVILHFCFPKERENTLKDAVSRYKEHKESTLAATFADSAVMCLSTDGANFRKNKYPSYKAARKGRERPEFYTALKEWAFENDPDAIGSPGGEADDAMLELAADAADAGEKFCLASIDKDLKTFPSVYFNLRTRAIDHYDAEYAMNFILEQFITGDSVDGIAGIYGMGPKKTAKYLDLFPNNKAKWEGIKRLWREHKDLDAFEHDSNLVFIRRRREDLRPLPFAEMSFDNLKGLLRFEVGE
jgi:5'-3' exonuclease